MMEIKYLSRKIQLSPDIFILRKLRKLVYDEVFIIAFFFLDF